MNLEEISLSLKEGSEKLSLQTAEQKNSALTDVYSAINKNRKEILAANKVDIQNAQSKNTKPSLMTRLEKKSAAGKLQTDLQLDRFAFRSELSQ